MPQPLGLPPGVVEGAVIGFSVMIAFLTIGQLASTVKDLLCKFLLFCIFYWLLTRPLATLATRFEWMQESFYNVIRAIVAKIIIWLSALTDGAQGTAGPTEDVVGIPSPIGHTGPPGNRAHLKQ